VEMLESDIIRRLVAEQGDRGFAREEGLCSKVTCACFAGGMLVVVVVVSGFRGRRAVYDQTSNNICGCACGCALASEW